MSLAERALAHTTLPALVFDAPLSADDASVLDLRALDVPQSDVELRNALRLRWRQSPRLVLRVDDEPSARIEALLLECVRREVRLTASEVDRFSEAHSIVVRVSAAAPSPRLARLFPVRVRNGAPSAAPAQKKSAPSTAASRPAASTAATRTPTPASARRTDARRR